jgi:methionyl-tRNA synthetase
MRGGFFNCRLRFAKIPHCDREVETEMPNIKTPAPGGDPAPVRFITTAIPYVNAPPHFGFALEMVQADVLARYWRAKGWDVRFQAGTDENSLKNVQAAEQAGVPVEELVETNAAAFQELRSALTLSFDDFIRTSAAPRHLAGVEKLWAACAAEGDIYKKDYVGLYCLGCEQFYRLEELQAGCCPEHKTKPEAVREENHFFRLSRYGERLYEAITSDELRITPAKRRNEVLRWIESGLEDFSISRPATRARGWGIPVPGDRSQVIYVWFDALGNYITALDYAGNGAAYRRYWEGADWRLHMIGKGITRFHAVYWPAILLSAGLPLPNEIFVHGYVTVDGEKIGKSTGNAFDPRPLAEAFGADALRYYLLRHIRATEDGDFSRDRLRQAYRSELAGQLGNLANRTLAMVGRYLGGQLTVPLEAVGEPSALSRAVTALPARVDGCVEDFAFQEALAIIWEVASAANKELAERQPWDLAKRASRCAEPLEAERLHQSLIACLADVVGALHAIGCSLAPFLPDTSARLLRQIRLGEDSAERGACPTPAEILAPGGELLFPPLA